MQLDRSNFKNQDKKLRKHHLEKQMLEKILVHIKNCNSYEYLRDHPMSITYGFEALKYELNGYYSFRLSKNGGKIRLICSIDKEYNIVRLEIITMDHYNEIKRK